VRLLNKTMTSHKGTISRLAYNIYNMSKYSTKTRQNRRPVAVYLLFIVRLTKKNAPTNIDDEVSIVLESIVLDHACRCRPLSNDPLALSSHMGIRLDTTPHLVYRVLRM